MHLLYALLLAILLCVTHCKETCNVQKRGVDAAAKKIIVNKHNELRAKVANGKQKGLPKAANMLEMVWDDAVAQKAQEWANKCKFAHDQPADRDTGKGYTGQNIAFASNQDPNPDWKKAIQDFYDEVSKFNANSIDKYVFQSNWGHFTQVIWAKTVKVGCGYVMHREGSNNVHLYGCNYFPGGNIVSEPIYEKGEPCSKCGGCGKIAGLCVAPTAKTLDEVPEYDEIIPDDEDEDEYGILEDLFSGLV